MACSILSFPTLAFLLNHTSSSGNRGDLLCQAGSVRCFETNHRRARRPRLVPESLNAETTSTPSSEPAREKETPLIELEFVSPQSTSDFQKLSAVSGEKNLRKFMLENKLELYAFYGKVMNCGGGGSCGTCIVEVLQGSDLLSEKTEAEHKKLKKKPDSWRLACQTIVGNKLNSGKVIVQRLPQKK